MTPNQARDLLDRAAAAVTPAETDPTTRLTALGKRSVRHRRAWGTAGVAAAVAAVVVALPIATAPRGEPAASPETTVSLGGLSVVVPNGWRTVEVETFDPCAAAPHTVYLAARWSAGGPGTRPVNCPSKDQAWLAVVREGVVGSVNPSQVVFKDAQEVMAEQPYQHYLPALWTYRALNDEIRATTAFISGDQDLLARVTWPAGPPAPPDGGLALPDRISSATTDSGPPTNGMVVATDTATLTEIRSSLAALRDPVPAGEECTLRKPGSVGISLGETTVVLGDASCPQAISTGGGRVRAPADLGQHLLDLIVASDRAASGN
ncbi:hypothetical protein [Asanoa sp. NPDC050611]|uniref:hypothetical protein n=1 Tax=Asanoa sp. NPDC050611 TaxID=3157098 RepID=UPI0033D4AB02